MQFDMYSFGTNRKIRNDPAMTYLEDGQLKIDALLDFFNQLAGELTEIQEVRPTPAELAKAIAEAEAAGKNLKEKKRSRDSRQRLAAEREAAASAQKRSRIERAIDDETSPIRMKWSKAALVGDQNPSIGCWFQLTPVGPLPLVDGPDGRKKQLEQILKEKERTISLCLDALDEIFAKVYYKLPGIKSPWFMRLNNESMTYIARNIGAKNSKLNGMLLIRKVSGVSLIRAFDMVPNDNQVLKRLIHGYGNDKQDRVLWVPTYFPDLYCTPELEDVLYEYPPPASPTKLKELSSIGVNYFEGIELKSVVAFLERITSGAGGGAMRSDKVEEASYLWSGLRHVGYALGLDCDRYVEGMSIPLEYEYIQTMLPVDLSPWVVETPVFQQTAEVQYFKKFDKVLDEEKKNQPIKTIPITFPPLQKKRNPADSEWPSKKKKGQGDGNLGEALKKGNTQRSSAGSVMQAYLQRINLPNLRSANLFAEGVSCGLRFQKFWTKLCKDIKEWPTSLDHDQKPVLEEEKQRIRTDQEWCHLYGHGDGGMEKPDNFISGSKHCNTLQLAIECGHRQQAKKFDYTIKVTAYLIPTDSHKYKNYEIVLPLGWYVRYKIYRADSNVKRTKIFDYTYPAQLESFDYNEFKILEETVRRVVAQSEGMQVEYNQRILQKVKKRFDEERPVRSPFRDYIKNWIKINS